MKFATSKAESGVKKRRVMALFGIGLVLLAVAGLGWPALAGGRAADRLPPAAKNRLAEALHLKVSLGESVWPGWGQADIPLVVHVRGDAFLVGRADPPPGWSAVAGDRFEGSAYYRQRVGRSEGPAVEIGGSWAAQLGATTAEQASPILALLNRLPPFLTRLLPLRAPAQPTLQADAEIAAALHETFHAYQAQTAPRHYEAAVRALGRQPDYGSAARAMEPAWQEETRLLAGALQAGSNEEMAALVREFLARRQARREQAGPDGGLADYERRVEWLEGTARYVAVDMWRHAYIASDYEPLPGVAADAGFDGYQTFDAAWSEELAALEQPPEDDLQRLAASGMAQAILLEFMGIDWKARLLADDESVALEDMLAQAVGP